jgi:yeast amino acid transporter
MAWPTEIKDETELYESDRKTYESETKAPSFQGSYSYPGKPTTTHYSLPPSDNLSVTFKHDLHRGLKSRQIAMVRQLTRYQTNYKQIAIGGAIGTGLIIGTGAALVRAGPAGVLISYCLVGIVIYIVMAALGEMSSYLPLPEGFGGCTSSEHPNLLMRKDATRFVDPALGFSLGWTYWLKYAIVTYVPTLTIIQPT